MKQIRDLINKQVEVLANGIVYRGVLKDISEQSVSLVTQSGWMDIQMNSINRISDPGMLYDVTKRYVDPSFYKE